MPPPGPTVRVVVLAAGAARRFGGDKLLATLDGRPVLQHALDRLAEAGIDDPIVVVSPQRLPSIGEFLVRRARIVANPTPDAGLASSLKVGWAAALGLQPRADAVLVVLGDQPRLGPELVRALVAAGLDPERPILAPRYRSGGGPNPLRIEVTAAPLVAATSGDRGLGPIVASSPNRVRWLDVEGANPDVDVPPDLARLAGH